MWCKRRWSFRGKWNRPGGSPFQIEAHQILLKQEEEFKLLVLSALKACGRSKDLETGRRVHSDAIQSRLETNIYVASTLVSMYAKCDCMASAQGAFDSMQQQNAVSWNSLIRGYATNGDSEFALELFTRMTSLACSPDSRTLVAALMACSNLAVEEEGREVDGELVKVKSLEKGVEIHRKATELGCDSDLYVSSTLIDMFSKCGSLENARAVFEGMKYRSTVSWNALIQGYALHGKSELAMNLYSRMVSEGSCKPDSLTFVAVAMACASSASKERAREGFPKLLSLERAMGIHAEALKLSCAKETVVANGLVDMYSKCGSLFDVRMAFDRAEEHNLASWNGLLTGCVSNGECDMSLALFEHMQREECCVPDSRTYLAVLSAVGSVAEKEQAVQVSSGKLAKLNSLERVMAIHLGASSRGCLDIFLANSLISLYSSVGSLETGLRVFHRMPQRSQVSWNAMILGCAENGEAELALELYERMKANGLSPNSRTFVAALTACGSLVAIESGRRIHEEIISSGLQTDTFVGTSLVDFYGKCGCMAEARQAFNNIAVRNTVTWSALMNGYSCQGCINDVLELFEKLREEGLQPDGITFLSVLMACSHSGLVDEGKEYFESMMKHYGIKPETEHYVCVLDMLGRANRLEEFVGMVNEMPMKANVVTWMTILGSCSKWKNVEVGKIAFETAVKLDERQAAAYLLMASIYASSEMWEKQSEVLEMERTVRAK